MSLKNIDLSNKRVLIRVDFNVPIEEGAIRDDTRIRASLPTIQYVIAHGGKVILMSHLGRPKGKAPEYSLKPCAERLSQLLKKPVIMAPDCVGKEVEAIVSKMKPGDVVLLENLRFYPAEEKPELDPNFAKGLAQLGDVFINDAFGASHRAHSSVVTIAQYFPKNRFPGFLLEKEIAFLGNALKAPKRPFFALLGGAKVSTKIGVIDMLLKKVDRLYIGGAMAFTFLKAQGKSVGTSLVEESFLEKAKNLLPRIRLPIDFLGAHSLGDTPLSFDGEIPGNYQGFDIGGKTLDLWTKEFQEAKTFFWNGPVGVFESPLYQRGTFEIAKCLGSLKDAITIAGGGETIQAINEARYEKKFSHISTGGGASLEFIEKESLPALDALA